MPKPDILLKEDRITVIGSGEDEKAGLDVTTGENEDPDIRLNPDWANISAGGGGGDSSEGDLFLIDKNDRPRVHISAEGGNIGGVDRSDWGGGNPMVWINGETGVIELGDVGDDNRRPPVNISAEDGGFIWLAGDNGTTDPPNISLNGRNSSMNLGGSLLDPEIWLRGSTGTVNVGHQEGSGPMRASMSKRLDNDVFINNSNVAKQSATADIWVSDSRNGFDEERLKNSAGLRLGNFSNQGALTMAWGDDETNNEPGVILADGYFFLGNAEKPGRMVVEGSTGATINVDGEHGVIEVGNENLNSVPTVKSKGDFGETALLDGRVEMKGRNGNQTVEIAAGGGNQIPHVTIGGNGTDGQYAAVDSTGSTTVELSATRASVTAGGDGQDGRMVIQPRDETKFQYEIIATDWRAGNSVADNGLIFRVNGNIPFRISPSGEVFINGQKVDPSNL